MSRTANTRSRIVIEIEDLEAPVVGVPVAAAMQLFGPADPVEIVLCLASDLPPDEAQAALVMDLCLNAGEPQRELPEVLLLPRAQALDGAVALHVKAGADAATSARTVALLTATAESLWDNSEAAQTTHRDDPASHDRLRAQTVSARRDVRAALAISAGRRRPTVVGLFQHISYWAAVEDVYRELASRPEIDFVPVALESSVDLRSGSTSAFLERAGLRPRPTSWCLENEADVDAVVLENPYDETRPTSLRVEALARAGIRIVGLPYGGNAIGGDFMTRLLWDMPLHRFAWRYYLPSQGQRELYARHCATGDEPVRVLGNPKHDRLVRSSPDGGDPLPEPIESLRRNAEGKRIVLWNPHFRTIAGGWSTFTRYLHHIIEYAGRHPDLVILVRPHFRLFSELAASGMGHLERELRAAVAQLPHLELDESADYRDALVVADAMISDLSSLATEFLVTGRPLLYLHRPDGPGPNREGDHLDIAARAEEWWQVEEFLDAVRENRDVGAAARRAALGERFGFLDGGVARRIADDVVRSLLDELSPAATASPPTGEQSHPGSRPTTSVVRGLRDEIVLTSFDGSGLGGNPLALANELERVGHSARRRWLVARPGDPVPSGCEPLLRGTPEHVDALSRAHWVVDDDATPAFLERRAGQVVLQTWHGTPLKKLRFDLHELAPRTQAALRSMDHQVRQWSHALSANPLSSEVLRRGFHFEGNVLEVGYPRNDVLADPDRRDEARLRARSRLGVAQGQRVLLYAPTWRDDALPPGGGDVVVGGQPTLDWADLHSVLGEEYTFWVRAHRFVRRASAQIAGAGVLDVTEYPDMADLLAAADVLVTDYSSCMFDFAITGRPMVFFTPDLEHYRERLRGHYFVMEDVVPGPLVAERDQVTQALALQSSWVGEYAQRYRQFQQRFAPWDDGKAALRTLEAVFS